MRTITVGNPPASESANVGRVEIESHFNATGNPGTTYPWLQESKTLPNG